MLLPALVAGFLWTCARPASDLGVALLVDRDVEGLDPHTSGHVQQTQEILANLYEGLVSLDARLSLVPALAASWTNPTETTWELTLRSGVRFHTGGQMDAGDVVFSLDRARFHPASIHLAALANVLSAEPLAGGRIRIRLASPDPLFLSRLREIAIVSRREVESRGDGALHARSAGTGPYLLARRRPGKYLDVARFDAYWRGPATVASARYVARSFGDPAAQALVPPGYRLVFWQRPGCPLYEEASRQATPHFHPGLSISYLSFDLRPGSPFLDRRVREAVALALDLPKLRDAVSGGLGMLPSQPVPPSVFGFDPELPAPRRDPAEARRLLEEAGHPGGLAAELAVRRVMAEYAPPVVEDLAAVGLRASVTMQDEAAFFRDLPSRRGELYLLRFACRSGDAQELLDRWVRSRENGGGFGEANYSYESCPLPGLDREIDEARAENSLWRRRERLQKALARVVEARLLIPLLHPLDYTFASPDLDWRPRADTFRLLFDVRLRSPRR